MGPHHPECPDRVRVIHERLQATGLLDFCVQHEAPLVTPAQLARAHALRHVHELQAADPAVAQAALAAYVAVRRRYQPRYESSSVDASIAAERLAAVISAFVEANSEGGRRAQAVVAGLLDIAFGTDRIVTGRINDPSRKHPGDICVKGEQDVTDDEPQWEKSIEVRDKRAGPIRLNSEPGPISGFSAVRKRRIGHAAGLCTAGRFGRLRRTGNRPAVHNPCGVPRSSLKPLSSAPSGWQSRTRPVSFDQGSSAAGVCCRTR